MEQAKAILILEQLKDMLLSAGFLLSADVRAALVLGRDALVNEMYLETKGHKLSKTFQPAEDARWVLFSEIVPKQSNPTFASTPGGAIMKARAQWHADPRNNADDPAPLDVQ